MQNLLEELILLLSEDDRLVSEGKLLKNKVIELALNMDAGLIKLLLKNEAIKRHFFAEIGGVLVFDKIKFQRFVSNKQFLPDSYTAFKNKIGLVNENDNYLSESRKVVLAWPYKDCVLEGGQTKEDQKRDEIFWNETLAPDEIDRLLAPKVFTNFKRYNKYGEHALSGNEKIDFLKENLIIKGNNLLALHSLYKRFAGRVKLIYIDPPFNTGSDGFKYNDTFNHATWLIFMKNRLEISKKLLKTDGFFCIHCSWHEHVYLTVLADEIFGRSNRLCTFNIQVRHPERILTGDKEYNDIIEYILIYRKDPKVKMPKILEKKEDDKYVYKITELNKGTKINLGQKEVIVFRPNQYKVEKIPANADLLTQISVRGSIREKNSSGRFYVKYLEELTGDYPPLTLFKVPDIGDDAHGFRYFYLPKEGNKNGGYFQGKPLSSDVTEKPYPNFYDFSEEYNNVAKQGDVDFRNGKKPEELLKFLIEIFTSKKDIIMDYHLGSGTTAAVCHKLNRQYIGIEQIDYGKDNAIERLKNVIKGDDTGISTFEDVTWNGGGSFIYCELMQYNEVYINLIQKAKTTKDLLAIWGEMQEKAFISYKVDSKTINANISEFEDLSLDEQKRFLIETLDKNQLYLNYSEIDDEDYGVTDTDKKLNRQFYGEA